MTHFHPLSVCRIAVAILCPLAVLTGCDSNDELPEGGGKSPTPAISLRQAAPPTESSLSFEIAPVDASQAVYMLIEADSPEPTADELFAQGTQADPSLKKTYIETGLASDTKYLLLAAAANEGVRSRTERLEMTTLPSAPVPQPSLELSPGKVTTHSIRFTLTPSESDRSAYLCLEKGTPLPDAEEIFSRGKVADPSLAKEYEVDNLASKTTYVVAAAAAREDAVSQVVSIELTTASIDPALSLSNVELTSTTIRFSITPQRAERVAYTYYKSGDAQPSAEEILSDGTPGDAAQYATYLIEGLEPATEYVIAAVAASGDELSEVATLTETTSAPTPPAMGDFYYSDGTWSSGAADPLPDKTCIGIVFYAGRCSLDAVDDCVYRLKDGTTPLDEVHGYVIALENAADQVAWGSWGKDGYGGAGTSYDKSDFRGYSNTQSIRNKAIEKSGALSDDADDNYPAAYYATVVYEERVPAPESSTGWFLPSAYQLLYLFPKVDALEASFVKLGREETFFYQRDAEYWSSTECQKENGCMYWAYYVSLDSSQVKPGFASDFRKSSTWFNVRSILVF